MGGVGRGQYLVGDLQQGVAGWGQCVGWCWEGAVPCR